MEIAWSAPGVMAVIDELEVHPDAERKRWPSLQEACVPATAGLANVVKCS